MTKSQKVWIWAIGVGLAASSAFAAGLEVTLGTSGEVYQVKSGAYESLFPAGKDGQSGNSVLAIEVTKPGEAPQRLLVRGTGDPEVESSPSLLYEEVSQTLFVLWESQNGIHPVLKLAGYDGTDWSEPILVTGNPFAPKTSPRFTITRESYEEQSGNGAPVTRHRKTLHLIWQEAGFSGGLLDTFYTPIVFLDGVYTGANPVYNLDDFLTEVGSSNSEVQPSLLQAPTIQAGRDERTVVAAFASSATRRLVAVEIDVLPNELSRLAEAARSHIIEIGRTHFPNERAALGEKARSHIIEIGVAFHRELRQGLADQVKERIVNGNEDTLESLAEAARSHIIEIGAKFSGRGLRSASDTAKARILEVGLPAQVLAAPAADPYLLQVRVASDRSIPRVGPGTVKLFVSESGKEVLVSWTQSERVVYKLSRGAGWTENNLELKLSPSLDLEKAYDILAQRIRNR